MTRRRIRCRAPAVKFDLLAGSQARDRASQARGYKAEGRARHPKKSRGLLREVRDGAACKMRARPREARTARQQPKVIRRTPIRAAELFVLQRQPRVSADQCHQRPDRHDARKRPMALV
jgi:hypothetical protein